jgi:hypothetical protein
MKAGKERMVELIGFVILILGLIGASLIRRHLREAKQLQLRQIIHEERIKAMEHSLPLPETRDSELIPSIQPQHRLPSAVLWVRIIALFVGLTCIFGGIGMTIGFYGAEVDDLNQAWSVGLIPVFIGIGLMIFYVMSRKLTHLHKNGEDDA